MTLPRHKVLEALEHGRITREEADAYLRHAHEETLEQTWRQRNARAFLALVFMVAVVAGGVFLTGGPTGFVTLDIPDDLTNVTNATMPVAEELTRLSVNGTLYGEGTATVTYVTMNGTYAVATIASDTGTVRTAEPSYAPGENVTLEHVMGNATYYLDDGNTSTPVSVPFQAPDVGTYEILVIQNTSGDLSTERVPLVVSLEAVPRTTVFGETCEETCTLPGLNGTIVIVTDNTTVDVRIAAETAAENLEPTTTGMPDMAITNETIVDLGQYFTDPEDQRLYYSTSRSELVNATVNGSLLTLTPGQDGQETFIVYASDLEHLIQTEFTLTVDLTLAENDTSTIVNDTDVTVNETNGTIVNDTSVTVNETNVSVPPGLANRTPPGLDCSHPNPNRRPADCLNVEAETYFEQDILLESVGRSAVARVTPIGNLVIRGSVIEQTNATPERGVFVVSRTEDFEDVPVAWIDNEGNLHLAGRLYEEVIHVTPERGSYAIINRRGVYMAYIDRQTGDLYLRGNVIPNRGGLT